VGGLWALRRRLAERWVVWVVVVAPVLGVVLGLAIAVLATAGLRL
jgi:hypothetical protein